MAFDADEMSKVDIEWCKQYVQRNNLHLIFLMCVWGLDIITL